MTPTLPPPNSQEGGVYSVGYNAWHGKKGLDNMLDALESEGVTILVDTRNSDFRARYSYQQLAEGAAQRTGGNGRAMRFAARPALSGKPQTEAEYNEAGQADYTVLDQRPEANTILDGMAEAAKNGERIALLCACVDTCTCHRTRWLAESLAKRGIEVGHLEPGEFDRERYIEEGVTEKYRLIPHSTLPDLPDHSDLNWRERGQKPQPTLPTDYHSPQSNQPIPDHPQHILIAGSMKANPAQLNYASALVVRAAEIGAQIHVGDNNQGVDARVVDTANAIGYEDVVVWATEGAPRNGGVQGGEIRHVLYNPREAGNAYTQRDRTMLRGLDSETDAAFFLSNGETHYKNGRMTGTEAGYVFAVEQGIPAHKVSFDHSQHRQVALQDLPTTYTPEISPSDEPPEPEPPPAPIPPLKKYPSLSEWEAHLRQQQGLAEPEPSPAHYEYSLYTHPQANETGQTIAYSTLAQREVYPHGEDQPTETHLMELARFDTEPETQHYTQSLKAYIQGKPELPLMGSPDETKSTQTFLEQVTQQNGLPIVEKSQSQKITTQPPDLDLN